MESTHAARPGTDPAPVSRRRPPREGNGWRDLARFLLKLLVIVVIVRSFLFSPFVIPSASMVPRLLVGDYLFITKWNYGYSRHSLPWSVPLIPGRLFPATPRRGDVVVFMAPPLARQNYIKRVIGLPGDTVQMQGGQLILNGRRVPKERIADLIVPVSPNFGCPDPFRTRDAEGQPVCRYPRFRETLPDGRSYEVLDQGYSPSHDDTEVFTVPAGHVFLMGDNRDDSSDSRFPAQDGGAIGFVPMENIVGKAVVTFWSSDGSARLLLPWTWFSANRWDRIGEGF